MVNEETNILEWNRKSEKASKEGRKPKEGPRSKQKEKPSAIVTVGLPGSGKSTIALVLSRLYEIQKGDILIDGVSIKKITQNSLRQLLSYVPQRPFLFQDTVQANIAFGESIDLEIIKKASKDACADEFIEKLPLGYSTEVQSNGQNFSGGQQQRIAIARALCKQAPILVLDEATAALDLKTEQLIKASLESLKGKLTQLVIAHRLTTIENADKIIFIENGCLIAQGNRQELIRSCESFRELWQTMQQQVGDNG